MFKSDITDIITKFKKLSANIAKFIARTSPKVDKAKEKMSNLQSNIEIARKIKAKIDEVLG